MTTEVDEVEVELAGESTTVFIQGKKGDTVMMHVTLNTVLFIPYHQCKLHPSSRLHESYNTTVISQRTCPLIDRIQNENCLCKILCNESDGLRAETRRPELLFHE